jgi:hypothetical protein
MLMRKCCMLHAHESAHFNQLVMMHVLHRPVCAPSLQPIMLGDAAVASELASRVQSAGIFCVAFSYPVVGVVVRGGGVIWPSTQGLLLAATALLGDMM